MMFNKLFLVIFITLISIFQLNCSLSKNNKKFRRFKKEINKINKNYNKFDRKINRLYKKHNHKTHHSNDNYFRFRSKKGSKVSKINNFNHNLIFNPQFNPSEIVHSLYFNNHHKDSKFDSRKKTLDNSKPKEEFNKLEKNLEAKLTILYPNYIKSPQNKSKVNLIYKKGNYS